MFNVKITNRYREDGGRWIVAPDDTVLLPYIRKTMAELMEREPAADWHLETRGVVADWHRWAV